MTTSAFENRYTVACGQDVRERGGVGTETVVVYLDLFFLVNALMDFLLLDLGRRWLGVAGRRRRLIPAALIGAAWSCAALLGPALPELPALLLNGVLPSAVMARLAYRPGTLREWGQDAAFLWLAAAAAGGFLGLVGDHAAAVWYAGGAGALRSWRMAALLAAAMGVYALLAAGGSCVWNRLTHRPVMYQAELWYGGQRITVTALRDTGNRLYEPYGHQPVHVLTEAACLRLCGTVRGVIYIPFRAVGTEAGILPAVRLDRMEVSRDGRHVRTFERPWVAVSSQPLSPAGRYEMLLHGEEQV